MTESNQRIARVGILRVGVLLSGLCRGKKVRSDKEEEEVLFEKAAAAWLSVEATTIALSKLEASRCLELRKRRFRAVWSKESMC